jgi:adenylosuccinate synthase
VGPLDLVATRYGVEVQSATAIALTKLDVLSYLEVIPVCVQYEIDGRRTDRFPFPAELGRAVPVTETLEGWRCDISGVRRWEDLPEAARRYVEFAEEFIGCPVRYISVGAERDAIIIR